LYGWLLPRRTWQELNILGEVLPFRIAFPQTTTGADTTEAEVTVELHRHALRNPGIWASNTRWRWQYFETSTRRWMDIITTHHRAYRLPGHPAEPWQQDYMGGENTRLPWVDAFEVACEWAALSADAYYTRRAIVREVWNLGAAGLLRYGITIPDGEKFVTVDTFHLTQFLDHLRHGGESEASIVMIVRLSSRRFPASWV
jgi:hypothetical protein